MPPAAPLVRGSARFGSLEWRDGAEVLPSRLAKLSRLLESRNCDAEALREQAWGGVPARYRTAVWQMLLGYLPLNRERQADSLARKKAEYQALVDQFCGPRAAGSGMSDAEQTVLRQVLYDAKRTNPEVPLFHTDFVQRSLERVLFVYSQRHFATGYVQGEYARLHAVERARARARARARVCACAHAHAHAFSSWLDSHSHPAPPPHSPLPPCAPSRSRRHQ